MKKIQMTENGNEFWLVIGTAKEIKLAFKELDQDERYRRKYPFNPKFDGRNMYGLVISNEEWTFHVVNASTALRLLEQNDWE